MEQITFDHSFEDLHLRLGITQERFDELTADFARGEWELMNPDIEDYDGGHLVEKFIRTARTPQELIMCAYIAGSHVEHSFSDPEELWDLEEE